MTQYLNKTINYLLIVFAFVLPFSTPLTNGVLVLLIVLWIIEGRWKEKYIILKNSPPFLLFFAFIVLIGLSILWSRDVYGGFFNHAHNAVSFYFRYYFFNFFIIPIVVTSMQKKFLRYIVSAFLSMMLISEIMSWGIFLEWIHYKNIPAYDPSPFMHHTLYSIFLAVTVFVLLTQFFAIKNIFYRFLISLFIISAIVNLFLNGGRLGQLAFFVTLFVYLVYKYRFSLKVIFAFLMVGVIVFLTAYKFSPVFQKRMNLSLQSLQKISNEDYDSSWGIRVNILIVAKEIVKEHPFLGVGLGDARSEFLEASEHFPQTGFFVHLNHLHNGYMQILVETGIFGLMCFFYFLYILLKIKLPKEQYILMISMVSIYLIGFIGEPLFFGRKPFLLFCLFIAFFLWQDAENKKVQYKEFQK